ncbi:hypothetical protein ACFPIJ_12000 [Dactylosporangium cerinum]|uniref:Uncharacterized protein n=1 Tax=Dactylosporangium cerinum TaxID=1434730 RepID=A0ABV9VSJ9_9ACTN
MITPEVESALRRAYARIPYQRASYYETEISERVLNELVSNVHRTQSDDYQLRNARRNAIKVLKSRSEVATIGVQPADGEGPDGDDAIARLELMEWLRTTDVLQDEERAILCAIAADMSVEALAAQLGFAPNALSVKISRIRRKARSGWLTDTR